MRLHQLIERYRLEAGLEVVQSALKAGVAISTWYKYESGDIEPPIRTLEEKIAPTLGKKLSDFFIPECSQK